MNHEEPLCDVTVRHWVSPTLTKSAETSATVSASGYQPAVLTSSLVHVLPTLLQMVLQSWLETRLACHDQPQSGGGGTGGGEGGGSGDGDGAGGAQLPQLTAVW